jgi:hypothetical protein
MLTSECLTELKKYLDDTQAHLKEERWKISPWKVQGSVVVREDSYNAYKVIEKFLQHPGVSASWSTGTSLFILYLYQVAHPLYKPEQKGGHIGLRWKISEAKMLEGQAKQFCGQCPFEF